MERQSIVSVLVVAMMFVVPLVPIAYCSESLLASDGVEQGLDDDQDEGQVVTRSVPNNGIHFYKDNLGVIWLFDIDSNNRATITGSFFGYSSYCEDGVLIVPSTVEYNLILDAPTVENNTATLSFSKVDSREEFVVSAIANGAVSTTGGIFKASGGSFKPSAPNFNMFKYHIMYGMNLPNSIDKISFNNCSTEDRSCFTELVIPNSVRSIGAYAFNDLPQITKISFADNSILETIHNNAFDIGVKPDDTSSMIVIGGDEKNLSNDDLNIIKNTPQFETVIVVIDDSLIVTKKNLEDLGYDDLLDTEFNPINFSDDSYTIRSEGLYGMMNNESGSGIFIDVKMSDNSSISRGVVVTIPDTVVVIEKKAFPNVGEVTFETGSKLEKVGEAAFENLQNKVITLPSSIKKIYKDSFNKAQLSFESDGIVNCNGSILKKMSEGQYELLFYIGAETDYSLPEGVTRVSDGAFSGCEFVTFVLRDGVSWGKYPFENSKIKTINFNGIREIPNILFGKSSIPGRLVIPSYVEKVGDLAFFKCNEINSLVFEKGTRIASIGSYAFAYCSINSVIFNDGAEGISCIMNDGAFLGCNSLETVTIKKGFVLTSIGDYAFTKKGVASSGVEIENVPIKVNSNSDYDMVIPSSVVFIGKFAFSGISESSFNGDYPKQNPTRVLPQTRGFRIMFEEDSMLVTLSSNSFGMDNLMKVDLSNCSKIESVRGFTSPKELILPDSSNLTSIAMESIVRDDTVTLQKITIPNSVRTISGLIYQDVLFEKGSQLEVAICSGNMDLTECASLRSVTLGGTVILPDGIYSIIKPVVIGFKLEDCIKNLDGIVVDATIDGKVNINDSVHAINKDLLGSVEVTGSNEIVWIEDGLVCSEWNGKKTAFGVSVPNASAIEIGSNSSIERIESGVFDNEADNKILRVEKRLDFGDSIFGQPVTPERLIEFNKSDEGLVYSTVYIDFKNGSWEIVGRTMDGEDKTISSYSAKVPVSSEVQVKFGEGIARAISGSNQYGWNDVDIGEGSNTLIPREHGDIGVYIGLVCYAAAVPEAEVFLGSGLDFPFNAFSNSGDMTFTFNVIGDDVAEDALEFGQVRIGRAIGEYTVFIPYDMDGKKVHIGELEFSENRVLFSASIDGGYTFYDTDITGVSGITVQDSDTISIPSGIKNVIILDITPKDRSNGDCRVTFQTDSSNVVSVLYIPRGMTILDSDIPVAVKDNHVFNEWMYGSNAYDFDTPVIRNIILTASWSARNPVVNVVTSAGDVTINGEHKSTMEISDGTGTVTVGISVYEGYEFLGWTYIQSGVAKTCDNHTLTLQNIDSDVTVSVDYRYYSTSSGLVPIVNRGFPTSEEISSAIRSWSTGGKMDMSGMNWTGHSSVPLIVDDYVYLRIGDKLCKVESDTGYCVTSVPSISQTTFYHQLGYGNGLIVDYASSKVYDVNLELKFVLDRTITGVEYHDGMFYTSGDYLYKFPADPSQAKNGVMQLELMGSFDHEIYSSYGFSSGIFYNGALYRVSADGSARGIAWMKLDGSAQGYTALDDIVGMYLDDGWMSINGNILYIGGYTEGLFGSVARSGCSTLVYMTINDDNTISNVNRIVFDGTKGTVNSSGFISEFVVCDGIGFVNVNSRLYAYDMNDDGTPGMLLASGPFTFGHGSFVIDSSHSSEEGNPLYVYMIPYRSGGGASTMAVMKCFWSGTDYVMKPVQAYNFESNYNSQALRAGLDGQMIWYNDSGWVYSYANPEDNRYFLFIRDGDSGRWYESTGGSAYAAFSKLGSDVLTFGKMKNLSTVNGRSAMDFSMYVVKYGDVSLKTYVTPTQVFDLRDSANDVYHYYIITSESGALAEGGSWSYIDDSMELKTYAFKFNIGDRSLVGKNMAVAGKESVVTFYDGETVVGKDMGAIGSKIDDLSYPNIVKEGLFVNWKLESDDKTFQKPEYRVDAEWISTIKEVSVSKSDDMYTVVAKLDRVDGIADPNVAFVAKYDDRVFWEFVSITSWGDEDSFVFKTSVLFDGLTSATLMFVDGSNYRDCVMVAIAECGLAV